MSDARTPLKLVIDLEAAAKLRGLSINRLCREAGIARSTFTRWKSGKTEPQYRILRKMKLALDEADKNTTAVVLPAIEAVLLPEVIP
jgi:transcriptional regulator with XRE-family HTH domain